MNNFNPLGISGTLWVLWSAYWFISSGNAAKNKTAESRTERLEHVAPIAAGMVLIFYGQFSPALYSNAPAKMFGALLTLCGLGFTVWARVHLGKYWSGTITLKEGHRLIRTGPYSIVRHPIYTGFIAGIIGSAIAASTISAFAGAFIVAAAYILKIRREETVLLKEFGAEYEAFKKETPALIPLIF